MGERNIRVPMNAKKRERNGKNGKRFRDTV